MNNPGQQQHTITSKMTINGILQLISTDENLSTVEIDNDLFSLNQIDQIVEFQGTVTGFLDSHDWWKQSMKLTKASRSIPDLANLPEVTLITPPYSFPGHARIGDFLGITKDVASGILEAKAKFCANCTKITLPQSLESIIAECDSDAMAISALASPEALSQHMFSKVIEQNEVKDLEETAKATTPLEVIIERIKLSNPDRDIRIRSALDFIEKNSLYDATIHSWPLGTFKQKIELASICRECSTPYLPPTRMRPALISAIWSLSVTDHPLLQKLFNPLASLIGFNFKLLDGLKLNHYSPAVLLKDLDPGHFHIMKIQQCMLAAPDNPVIISPFDYLLPPAVSHLLLNTLEKGLSPSTRIIAAILAQNPVKHRANTTLSITPNKIPAQIEPSSRTILELNRTTIDEETSKVIESAIPPNYKTHSLAHTHPKNSQRTQVASYLGLIPHIARLYANHPTARALGLEPKFFSHEAFAYSCTFCGGAGIQCTFCKGRPFPPDIYLVKFKGKSLASLLEQELTAAMEIVGRIPKVSAILTAAMSFGLGSLRLNQTLSELNIMEQWLLRILKFLLQTPQKSCIILPDLRWCLNEGQNIYVEKQILKRLEQKGIVFEINMKLDVQ